MHAFVSKQRKTTYVKITIAKTIEGQRLNFDQFFIKSSKTLENPNQFPWKFKLKGGEKKERNTEKIL
jgi:hypothetical protein